MSFADLLPWHTGPMSDLVLIRTGTHSWPRCASNAPHRGNSRRAGRNLFFGTVLFSCDPPRGHLWKTADEEHRSIPWISLLVSSVYVNPTNPTPPVRRHGYLVMDSPQRACITTIPRHLGFLTQPANLSIPAFVVVCGIQSRRCLLE